MKTAYSIFVIAGMAIASFATAQTRTSVANGDWYNPSTWSPAGVPGPSDNIIIVNTDVTFSQNITITPQSQFKVNAGKSLVNTTGQDSLIFGCDVFNNAGYISAGFFAGEANDTTYNSGSINLTNDFVQSGITWNRSTGSICCGQNMIIGQDMLNDGSIACMNLINGDNATGTGGRYCVSAMLLNTGAISGTVDVCDATPNQMTDITGVMALSVTSCGVGPCSTCLPNGIEQHIAPAIVLQLQPNPFTGDFVVTLENAHGNKSLQLFDYSGKCVRSETFNSSSIRITRGDLAAGVYFVRVADEAGNVATAKVIAE